jgi:hypothetical protein
MPRVNKIHNVCPEHRGVVELKEYMPVEQPVGDENTMGKDVS